jgi:beta-mannosidase
MTGKRVQQELRGPWSFRQIGGDEVWMPAAVPGCVHTDLAAGGKIEDPFYGTNEKDQQWIERCGWEYTSSFHAEDALLAHERIDLVCKGLDTYADVWIGESKVLSANNMFREWRADVRDFLRHGANTFRVRFRSPIEEVDATYDALGYVLPASNDQATRMVSMFTRKAPYHYGWDWGPRFVTSGIWRPILLDAWERARIDDAQVLQTELTDARARLRVRTTVVSTTFQRARVDVSVGGVRAAAEADVRPGANLVDVDLVIDRPQRWWPNGLGKAHLYDVRVALSLDADAIDVRSLRVGLRTVEVEHARDAAGKSFSIRVNGAPTFMKGANYIPSDSFVNRVTGERHRQLLQSAVDANMNMLRVWGGGIYEDDRFYDLCDELGLLVWQDFMFACSMYPGDDAFVANVREEAIENVRRLRNHPSVALWSGNNEIEVAWRRWGWQQKYAMSEALQASLWKDYQRVFHELLPAVVAEHDPGRFYTRSSPSANDDAVIPDTVGFGDMHYWGVWHAEKPYEEYARQVSRFMSEYGFQSFPELDTVAAYAPASEWRIDSPVMLAHQRHPRGNALVGTYMERDFRAPKDFDSFLYVSQVLQAVVIEFAAHAHRRAMPANAGSLYWQLDDCWPVASWSGIDYFGRWKALHYFAKRFFAPVIASVIEDEGTVSIWIVCDRRRGFGARLRLRLIDFDGVEVWRDEREVRVEGNSSRLHASFPRDAILGSSSPTRVVLVAEVLADGLVGGRAAADGEAPMRALHYFVKTKDLELPDPELGLAVQLDERGAIAVRVSSRRLAKNVRLRAEPANGRFEDNYFDLLPGETAWVRWTGSSWPGVTATSIRDTYDGP